MKREGVVYFVQSGATGPIKIGTTTDVTKRLGQLQVGSAEPLRLLATVAGGVALEQSLHARLASHRMAGEWFRPSAELVSVLRDEVLRALPSPTLESPNVAAPALVCDGFAYGHSAAHDFVTCEWDGDDGTAYTSSEGVLRAFRRWARQNGRDVTGVGYAALMTEFSRHIAALRENRIQRRDEHGRRVVWWPLRVFIEWDDPAWESTDLRKQRFDAAMSLRISHAELDAIRAARAATQTKGAA